MQNWLKAFKAVVLIFLFVFTADCVWANSYSAHVRDVHLTLEKMHYEFNADIDFVLSPIAKEALQKGIPLSWRVVIQVRREGFFWDSTVKKHEMVYKIQNHALMNLFSVKNMNTGSKEMYSTLTAALSSISKIRGLLLIEKASLKPDEFYYTRIKIMFDRESLPVPLRPVSYFNSEWALSSQWSLWPLQN